MNTITIDLFVSKNFEGRDAVRKVSDKLTVVNTYLPGAKKEDGTFEKSLSMSTKITSKTEVKGEIAPQKRVRVTGFVEPNVYKNKDGVEIAVPVIVARAIEVIENSANNKTTDDEGFIPIPEGIDEELPFR